MAPTPNQELLTDIRFSLTKNGTPWCSERSLSTNLHL